MSRDTRPDGGTVTEGGGNDGYGQELFDDVDLGWEHLKNRLFLAAIFAASMFGVVALALLLLDVATDFYVGITEFNIGLVDFLTNDGSRRAERAGFRGAIVASAMLMALTAALASLSASDRRSTWRSTRRTTGSPGSSRRTYRTSPASPRSCTGS